MQNSIKQFTAAVLVLCMALSLCACGGEPPVPEVTPAPSPTPVMEDSTGEGAVRISELMVKNHAAVRSLDGNFYDWAEIENIGREVLDLTDWELSDGEDKPGWRFPAVSLAPGEQLVIYASKADGAEGELHADFALSAGETLVLRNASGHLLDSVLCPDTDADVSLCAGEDGSFSECLYPTPGLPNSPESYELWQDGLDVPAGLIIHEVSVDSFPPRFQSDEGCYDWVELKNNSDKPIDLNEYYLSDDPDDYFFFRLPDMTLAPGALVTVACPGKDPEEALPEGGIYAPFKLDSRQEQLFLSTKAGLADYVSLRDIPYMGTYGRVSGRNGFFFFSSPTPGKENGSGCRRVSAAPVSPTADGIFEDTDSVTVELSARGAVYYTLDGSLPTAKSTPYTEPVTLTATSVLRAVSVEESALPSRPLTLSFFLNEHLTLPALSIVSDDVSAFHFIYNQKQKGVEVPGNLALYDPEGSLFNLGCGIKMNGATSLELFKKNMSFRFRGSYGQDRLNCDLFGGGVTEFSNLLIRAGQDYYSAIIRSELAQELCLQTTDTVVCQRTRYCVAYVNGKYFGIYAIKDKANEQMYADLAGVSRDSVTLDEAPLTPQSPFYDVFLFCTENDMAKKENYERFCSLVDIDSLIDWVILEAYCCNDDLTSGNVRYVRSDENDGKWRLVFFDLDSSFHYEEKNYTNLFSDVAVYVQQISKILDSLRCNAEFRDRLLTRAAYHLSLGLSNENALAVIDRLADEIRSEVERDCKRADLSLGHWERNVQYLRDFITENNWQQYNIDTLCELFELTDAERIKYFGE